MRLLLEFDGRVAEAARLRARLEEMEPRLQRSEAAREEIVLENSRQLSHLAERDAVLNRAEAAHSDLTSRVAALAETATAKQDALAMQNQAMATSQATMEGALRAARLDRVDLQKEIERLRARLSEFAVTAQTASKGDQALRQSIARLGREIARGYEAPDKRRAARRPSREFRASRTNRNGQLRRGIVDRGGPSAGSAHRLGAVAWDLYRRVSRTWSLGADYKTCRSNGLGGRIG